MTIKLSELIDTNDHARIYIWFKDELLLLQGKDLKWTIPGGHMKRGETPEEAILREVKEETGITLPMEPSVMRELDNHEGGVLYLFSTRTNQKYSEIRLSPEFNQFRWFPVDQIPTRSMTPVIVNNINSNP